MKNLNLVMLLLCLAFSCGGFSTLHAQSIGQPLGNKTEGSWKAGIGYEYFSLIQPDTGRGVYRGFNVRIDRAAARRLWLGSGLTIGRIALAEVIKVRIIDRSVVDSLGFFLARDSIISEHRWQNHIAVPLRLICELIKKSHSAVPLSIGATFGWSFNQGSINQYDKVTHISKQGSPDGFTGFITADLGLGYEVYQYKGISATLSAEYRRVIAGSKSFGYGQNFIGGRILLNLDFDARRWIQ